MQAYQRKSHKMLRRLWRGPHGFEGRYEFSGEFFENITYRLQHAEAIQCRSLDKEG